MQRLPFMQRLTSNLFSIIHLHTHLHLLTRIILIIVVSRRTFEISMLNLVIMLISITNNKPKHSFRDKVLSIFIFFFSGGGLIHILPFKPFHYQGHSTQKIFCQKCLPNYRKWHLPGPSSPSLV